MTAAAQDRSAAWKWSVCGLLLLATMLNYMDRQTLALTATDIGRELGLTNEQYGNLEFGFGLAFAAGSIIIGLLADRLSVRWLYVIVLVGWSLAGVATAHALEVGRAALWLWPGANPSTVGASATAYLGLILCRVTLGFFEAGQWPCALVTSQRVLPREDRTLGNSILQSGASLGAIFTPLIVQSMVSDEPGSWRLPYQVIGLLGITWVFPWLTMVRHSDIAKPAHDAPAPSPRNDAKRVNEPGRTFVRRFAVLMVVVTAINITWHYFRAWLPKLLREFHGYPRSTVNYFTSAYYIATDLGCLSTGAATKWLAARGYSVHSARVVTFLACSLLTSLSTVAAGLPRGPLLLGILLVIGFGSLGLFPNYYALTQDLSTKHQGKVVGFLAASTWIVTAMMQRWVGITVDATHSYASGIFLVGLAPLAAWFVLLLFWNSRPGTGDDKPERTAK